MFSFDVSQAFAKCMAVKELRELIGVAIGEAQFDFPRCDVDIFRRMSGFTGFYQLKGTVLMFKPMMGSRTPREVGASSCTM